MNGNNTRLVGDEPMKQKSEFDTIIDKFNHELKVFEELVNNVYYKVDNICRFPPIPGEIDNSMLKASSDGDDTIIQKLYKSLDKLKSNNQILQAVDRNLIDIVGR